MFSKKVCFLYRYITATQTCIIERITHWCFQMNNHLLYNTFTSFGNVCYLSGKEMLLPKNVTVKSPNNPIQIQLLSEERLLCGKHRTSSTCSIKNIIFETKSFQDFLCFSSFLFVSLIWSICRSIVDINSAGVHWDMKLADGKKSGIWGKRYICHTDLWYLKRIKNSQRNASSLCIEIWYMFTQECIRLAWKKHRRLWQCSSPGW